MPDPLDGSARYGLERADDGSLGLWRPAAKDGAELSTQHRSGELAETRVATGETRDYIVRLDPGEYVLRMANGRGAEFTNVPILVGAPAEPGGR